MREVAAYELIGAARWSTHQVWGREKEEECCVFIELNDLFNVQLMIGNILCVAREGEW